MSTVAPTSLATESTFLDVNGKNRMRLDGPLGDADLSSFVSVNTDFVERLNRAGLITDDVRGLTTSGARREKGGGKREWK